jgi:branched-chain amino acid transport system ATP-binding protein
MLEGRVALEGPSKAVSRDDVTKAYFGLHRKNPGSVPA